MIVRDKLTSVLAAADDAPYFPSDAYEQRLGLFLVRGAALVLLAVMAHLLGIESPWIWTDHRAIADNILLHSARGMAQFWFHPFATGRTPLGGTLLYLQYLAPAMLAPAAIYHLTTLLAHAGNCLLVWVILRRLQTPGAWLAAAIFAVHPIEVQSIGWASRQADVLGATAGLASLLCFLKLKEIHPPAPPDFGVAPPNERRLRITMTLLFVAAALFQPSIVTLAGVFPLILWWKRGKVEREDLTELAPILAFAGLLAAIGLVYPEFHHEGGPAAALNPLDRLIVSGRAVWFYVETILCPQPLLFVYPRWELTGDLWMLVFSLALAAVITAMWRTRNRLGSGPLVAVAAFIILILPHLPFVRSEWMGYTFVADHLQYLPGMPLIALFAASLTRLADLIRWIPLRRGARLAGIGLVVAGLGTLAVFNTLIYASEVAVWKYTLENDPLSLTARAVLSEYYLRLGKLTSADQFRWNVLDRIERMTSHGGADAGATVMIQMSRASFFESQQQYTQAAKIYRQVLSIDPRNHEAAIRLALAYKRSGDVANALRSFADAALHYPTDDALLNEYGLALVESGRIDDGIEKYRDAIRLNYNFVAAHLNLSNALFAQGKFPEAAEQLHIAVQIDPRSFEAFMNAGIMLANLKNYPAAERQFKAAVQLHPDSAEARDDLGVSLAAQGYLDEAIDNFIQAIRLKPDFQHARDDLARAQAERDAKRH